jgi:hypothetical protein
LSKVILTDIDETVLQYAAPFTAWCLEEGFKPQGDLRDSYSVREFLGVSEDVAVATMERFAAEGNLGTLPPEPDAARNLLNLYRAGWRFVGITAMGGGLDTQKERKALLERTFGFPWEAVHVVGLGQSKTTLLNAYDPTVWVEDNGGHAMVGAALGHRTFLLDRGHNRGISSTIVTRVQTWDEIADTLYREA